MGEIVPSRRELDILKVLWEHGPATVRDVHGRLCPDGELAFNTVQTTLRIMDEKGLVRHRRDGRTFVYSPVPTREKVTSGFVDQLFDGALEQFVLSLVSARGVSDAELRRLEKIIAEARKKKRGKTNNEAEG